MDRTTTLNMPGTMDASMMMPGMAMPMPSMGMTGMMTMPRCTMTMEMVNGGCSIKCVCQDEMSAKMMQNMCAMMTGAMCGMMCTMNGMCVCMCNMMMGSCKMEAIDMGMMMTCTSGDEMCAAMIQACCKCMMDCMAAGCCCCMTMNGMPVCSTC